ncbi:MAG: CoB--CoM heterodisulfide reductase iron-sulfur subunit A family protein [Candidatus Lokiarchaeota archaeon]|nr:CoB--CoM heterodisulfide reductase iron-sulfur subunit A family protein [Candidatus Lokiarchaeota archaeon]
MLQAARTEGLNIYTYSELDSLKGFVGNFDAKIRRKARYVTKDCNGCGACEPVCPAISWNDFNEGLNPRSAIYTAFAQAVPSIAQIDMEKCIKCGLCQKACELNAIDFDQKDIIQNIRVGTIIVATGWDEYKPPIGYLGYNTYPNVITQMKLERILAPNGPTFGHIVRPSDGKRPKRILFIQCVGSRDLNKNTYCSSGVCCMISIKNTKLIKQHYPDSEITVAYVDIRAAGKDYEEYFTASRKEGIRYVRTNVSRIEENPENHNLIIKMQNTLRDSLGLQEKEFELIVLSCAMIPPIGIKKIQRLLKLETSRDGFFKEFHPRLNPIDTKIPGIILAGVSQSPKSIADSITSGRAAASSAARLMSKDKYRIALIRAKVNKDKCAKCGLCELNCPYNAINLLDDGADVNEILCRGCGTCLANCPSEAIILRYYKENQYEKQIDAILEKT